MKKILSILGTINLIGTITTNLVACNTAQEYTKEELAELKKENQINTTNENIKNNLEWITPQEKPFNEADNKWYYVVWRSNSSENWNITKFKNDKKIDKNNYKNLNKNLYISTTTGVGYSFNDLFINNNSGILWKKDIGFYFKSVYRWNLLDKTEPNLDVDKNGNVIVKDK
ncbi:MAG: lipoprotein [Spiroplasma phoeniceum]|nr:MAG: lipoprotein [Spiroplasma phoeniceum]UZQ33219.1 MAG: lipoprotein [Spiroplasma phoeniceum]